MGEPELTVVSHPVHDVQYKIFRLPFGYENEYAPWVAQRVGGEINLLSSRRFDSQEEAMEWVNHLLNLLA